MTPPTQEIDRHDSLTNPFNIIRWMTRSLEDITAEDRFLEVLTLDDWVVLYRLSIAAGALGVTPHEELVMELSRCGMHDLCRDLSVRITDKTFGDAPEFQFHLAVDMRFNLAAHLEQGILRALTPDITALTN